MSSAPESLLVYVDDEELNLRVFDAAFGRSYNVRSFRVPEEALHFATQRAQDIAIVLTDQRMPGMSGLELLEKMRVVAPEAQRMLVTAFSDMRGVIEAVNRGQISRYFVKPWNRDELGAAFDEGQRVHQLHGRLRDMEGNLRTSERLAAIGQLSAGLAHELMNPVSYITQNLVVLEREMKTLVDYVQAALVTAPNPPVKDIVDDLPALVGDLLTGIRHIRGIADGVKTHVRVDAPQGSCGLSETVPLAVKLAYSALSARPNVQVEGPAAKVRAGQVQVCQIIVNLIVNAAQAMAEHNKGSTVRIGWRVDGDKVQLRVSDDGPGIPEEIRERVFEPFFTTKPVGVGTGLGLGVCRDLARKLGGDLMLESKAGAGTTLTVTLLNADAPLPENLRD